jgi:hypothetical protein
MKMKRKTAISTEYTQIRDKVRGKSMKKSLKKVPDSPTY